MSLEFANLNGINNIKIPQYHQSTNGTAERFVQTRKKGFKCSGIEMGNIQRKLDNFMFAHQNTVTNSTGLTHAEPFI